MSSITLAILSLACAVVWSGTDEAEVHELGNGLALAAFICFVALAMGALVGVALGE